MKLKIAYHAEIPIPAAMIAPPEPSHEMTKGSPEQAKAPSIIRRSTGLMSVTSMGAIPYFLISQDLTFSIISTALLAGSSLSMALSRKHTFRDFFPKLKSKPVQPVQENPVVFTPYKNWDNAFLPYAGEVVNIGYQRQKELPKGAILGGSAMGDFYVWMNISDESKKRKILRNFYGEVDNTGFWSSMYCRKAVRFYEE